MIKKLKIIAIIGTRPQYIKHAAFCIEAKKNNLIDLITIDTGQHYDHEMSNVFIDELQIDNIKYNLDVNRGLHGEQTAKMLMKIETILLEEKPDVVLLYGDTNSTLAGSIAASKLIIPIVHIEAGMRNNNIKVPEEINRIVTDHISTLCFAPSNTALANLHREGLQNQSVMLGDIVTDIIYTFKTKFEKANLSKTNQIFATIHRPYNTLEKDRLVSILEVFNKLDLKVILPLHPRTRKSLQEWNISLDTYKNIDFILPVSFEKSLEYIYASELVITDSGGIQREAYIMKTPCITILPNTPWEETLIGNWNQIVFDDVTQIATKCKIKPDSTQYIEQAFGTGAVAKDIVNYIITKFLN